MTLVRKLCFHTHLCENSRTADRVLSHSAIWQQCVDLRLVSQQRKAKSSKLENIFSPTFVFSPCPCQTYVDG